MTDEAFYDSVLLFPIMNVACSGKFGTISLSVANYYENLVYLHIVRITPG